MEKYPVRLWSIFLMATLALILINLQIDIAKADHAEGDISPPLGFEWYKPKKYSENLLVPIGWHVSEELNNNRIVIRITEEDQPSTFATGMRITYVSNYSNTERGAYDFVSDMIVMLHEAGMSGDSLATLTIKNIHNYTGATKVILHEITGYKDELTVMSFQAPEEFWDDYYNNYGAVMLRGYDP